MTYTVTVVDDITQIDPTAWDQLNDGLPFSSYRWLSLSRDLFIAPRLVLAYDGDRLVGWTIATQVWRSPEDRYPLLRCQRVAFCGPTFIAPDAEALRLLLDAINDIASAWQASTVVWMALTEHQRSVLASADTDRRFRLILADPETALPIRWPSFDSYLRDLPRAIREEVQRHNRRAQDRGITVERTQSFMADAETIVRLITEHRARHAATPVEPDLRAALARIEQDFSDNSVMLLARINGEIVGCGLLMQDQGVAVPVYLGLDARVRYVYFQLYYEAIRCAVEQQARVIEASSGGYEFKRHMGFVEYPAYLAVSTDRFLFRLFNRPSP